MKELAAGANGTSADDLQVGGTHYKDVDPTPWDTLTLAIPKSTEASGTRADDLQVGGTHYKDLDPQPWAVMQALLTPEEFRGFLKGNMIKYAMRQGKKDSPDAGKFWHYHQKLHEVTEGDTWV